MFATGENVPPYTYNIMCRLCGCLGSSSYIQVNKSLDLVKLIAEETLVVIHENDALPNTVCGDCMDKVYILHHFREQIRKTQKVLQNSFLDKTKYLKKYCNKNNTPRKADTKTIHKPSVYNSNGSSHDKLKISTKPDTKIIANYCNMQVDLLEENSQKERLNVDKDPSELTINNANKCSVVYQDINTLKKGVPLQKSVLKKNATKIPINILQQLPKKPAQVSKENSIIKPSNNTNMPAINRQEKISKDQILLNTFETPYVNLNEEINNTSIVINQNVANIRFTTITGGSNASEGLLINTLEPCYINLSDDQNVSPFLHQYLTNNNENTKTTSENLNKAKPAKENINYVCGIQTLFPEESTQTETETHGTTNNYLSVLTNNTSVENNENIIRTDRSGRIFKSVAFKYVKKVCAKKYICTICDQLFRFPHLVEKHVREHFNEKPFVCKICNKKFISGYYLTKHEQRHDKREFMCEYCGRCYHLKYYLEDHLKIHSEQPPVYECPICDKIFHTKLSYQNHKILHNTNSYICELCGKQFTVKSRLKRHVSIHGKKIFECTKCKHLAKSKRELLQHMKTHERNGLYTCQICLLSFWTTRGLNVHEREKHKIFNNNNNKSGSDKIRKINLNI